MNKLALLFPGQGTQYVGMGKTLFEEYGVAREVFDEANIVLNKNIKNICFEGSHAELNRIENMLPAILTVSVAAFRVYMQEVGVTPLLCAGHSLGEYSALTCSGGISFADALRIVNVRGLLAQEISDTGEGSMTVVDSIDSSVVEAECKKNSTELEIVTVACYNSNNQVVICGNKDAVIRVEDVLMEMDAQVTPLLMSPPFHCHLMQPTVGRLEEALKKVEFKQLDWPVMSNVSGQPYSDPNNFIKNLSLQLVKPVQWNEIMDYITQIGITTVVELGPQAILTNLIKTMNRNINAYAFGQKDDRENLKESLFSKAKPDKNDKGIHAPNGDKDKRCLFLVKCLKAAVCTRNSNWNDEEYKKGVIEPYERIERIQKMLDEKGTAPSYEQMCTALDMLRSIFSTKRVQIEQQVRRFEKIFEESGTKELFANFEISEKNRNSYCSEANKLVIPLG